MRFRIRGWIALGLVLGLTVVGGLPSRAANIDPESEKVLREMTAFTEGLKSFRTELLANYKLQIAGANTKVNFVYSVAGEKPNRLATIARSGEGAPIIISDGKKQYTFVPALGKYMLGDAPASFVAMLDSDAAQGAGLGHAIFAGALLPFMSYYELDASLEEAKYVGEVKLGPAKCHQLKLSQKLYDWNVWIDIGKRPLIRKIEPDMTKWLKANPGPLPADAKVEVSISFKTWATDVALKDKDFKIEPAAGAQEVASFSAPAGAADGPETLKGKPAPPFTLAVLGGGQANLAAHQGKEVVMLDFWATWCGPCVAALPQIAEVASAYRSRGVAFYAVNLREDAAKIEEFLREKQLPIPVAMDTDGSVAGAYKARAIPQTVLIGKDGNVHVVHVGAGGDIKTQLAGELDALLAMPGAGPTPTKKK